MFLTKDIHFLGCWPKNQGAYEWDEVEIAAQSCILLLQSVERQDQNQRRRLHFVELACIDRWSTARSSELEDIKLLSPGYMNGSGSWALDSVREVWRCDAAIEGVVVPIASWLFDLANGRELLYAPGFSGTPVNRVTRTRRALQRTW